MLWIYCEIAISGDLWPIVYRILRQCLTRLLRSSKNASKSTFLEFLDGYSSSLQIWPPEKFLRGKFFRSKWRHCNRPCALSVSRFPSRVGTACLFVESVHLLFAFGVLACRILDCASLPGGLLSSKLRCLRLKIELLAFWGPACLRRKKWPSWARFGQSLARLMILLKCKHKRGLICRDATWRVFVTWLGQLFIMFTITTSKHLGFYMLTVSSFISFAVDILLNLLNSASVANKPKPRNENVIAVYFYLSAEIFESVARRLLTINWACDRKCWQLSAKIRAVSSLE